MDPIGYRKKKYYGSHWGPLTVWLPTFFKIPSFVLSRRQTRTGFEQLEAE